MLLRGENMAGGVHRCNPDKFSEAVAEYMAGRVTQAKAAQIARMSTPTFLKYLNMLFSGKPFPDTLFVFEDKGKVNKSNNDGGQS